MNYLYKGLKNSYYLINGMFFKIFNLFQKPKIYDVFIAHHKESVCVIGPYYSHVHFSHSTCIINDNERIKCNIIKDPQKSVLIVLFKMPQNLKVKGDLFEVKIIDNIGRVIFNKKISNKRTPSAKNRISITTLFKNDHGYMKEWLNHHIKVGVDHFYLYENNPTTDTRALEILKPYIEGGRVTHIRWPHPYKFYSVHLRRFYLPNCHRYTQIPQINHCLYKYGYQNNYILSCDMDEFYHSDLTKDINQILIRYNREDISCFYIKGLWFGSNGYEKIPDNKKVLETFIKSEKEPSSPPKVIYNPINTDIASIHNIVLGKGKVVNIPFEELGFNHYMIISPKRRKINHLIANEIENKKILK